MAQQTTGIQASFLFPDETAADKQPIKKEENQALPWIKVAPNAPYFITDEGEDWTPIGQNDAITWPELQGLFKRRDPAAAEAYFRNLAAHGVTCMRLMLEYCQGEHRYLERPAGHFQPNMVQLWDDVFALCRKWGIRLLLTPYDTFWMWRRWSHHPYHTGKGGPCAKRNQWLRCPKMRAAIKHRLQFATERWGGSGVLFAWDLWNEIHPAHSSGSADSFAQFIEDIGGFLSQTEQSLHGRAHLQTVSVFEPVLHSHPAVKSAVFRHPSLDFASVHFYEKGTIDYPKNTVDAARSTGRLTCACLAEIGDNRPFLDSEHGPIHAFKDRKKTLAEAFDDEYFRHMQWAHFASGGAGGGMRWPNRHPHSLTPGMRRAQLALSRFLPLISWQRFQRKNKTEEIMLSDSGLAGFACGDAHQTIVWLLRTNSKKKKGLLDKGYKAGPSLLQLPHLQPGRYKVTAWNTEAGMAVGEAAFHHTAEDYLRLQLPPIATDLALAVRRIS